MTAVTSHADGYVRFRALVLLAGIGDPRTRDVMIPAIDDANDRLREVAYAWLEWNPEPPLAPKLIAKLETEVSEFVRPSLVRALAALGADPKVRAALLKDVSRGEDVFRSAVIEALGAAQGDLRRAGARRRSPPSTDRSRTTRWWRWRGSAIRRGSRS